MRKKILQFFNANNLVNEKEVNSLILSVFLYSNNIQVNNNAFLLEILNYTFTNKIILRDNLLSIIRSEEATLNLETLIQLFEFVISPSTKVVNGAVYTPNSIREFIIESLISRKDFNVPLVNLKFADMSCGCGAFLLDLARLIKKHTSLSYGEIFENLIFGIDIEPYAIERAKILLSLLGLLEGEDTDFRFNLIVGDALTFNWKEYILDYSGFNIIVGNPPYVAAKHMSDKTRKQLGKMQTCRVGNPDLYIPFFEIGIENLATNGKLGLITMNSFFKSLNARNLRQYFQEKSFKFKIIDFGAEQVFHSRNTYTCICLINNTISNYIKYNRIKSGELKKKMFFFEVPYQYLDYYNGWNLYESDLIRKIESIGVPLGEKYKTSHGLATLKNNIYIFRPSKETDEFYYLVTKEGKEYPIEKSICVTVINSNKLSRASSIERLQEQLIFPYTNERKPKILEEEFFRRSYPHAYSYLHDNKEILASRDKGKGKYQIWYAYGRSQGLEQVEYKMFFPKYSDKTPHYLINSSKTVYFYNGQAFLGSSIRELKILKKILETRLFWFYISSTSKPYASNYYSLNGTYIKNFGVCHLTKEEENYVLQIDDKDLLNQFFETKYNVSLDICTD